MLNVMYGDFSKITEKDGFQQARYKNILFTAPVSGSNDKFKQRIQLQKYDWDIGLDTITSAHLKMVAIVKFNRKNFQ